ncbi:MAG: hypothetical protein WAR79_02320 [Melioribacteraceae bacterium]
MKSTILILIFILILSTGCSIIGYGVGYVVKLNKETLIPLDENIDSGKTVIIKQFDGTEIQGFYINCKKLHLEEYKIEFEHFVKKFDLENDIPKLGDKIKPEQIFINNDDQKFENNFRIIGNRFFGFDFNSILVSDSNFENSKRIPFSSIEYFGNGKIENSKITNLSEFYEKGELPLISDFQILSENKIITIPGNKIKEIIIYDKSNLATFGFILGLAADVYLLANTKFERNLNLGPIR